MCLIFHPCFFSNCSVFRDPVWDCQRVSDWLPFLKWTPNPDYWTTFRRRQSSIFWDCLTKPGEVDCRIFPTSWIKLIPQGGTVPIIIIRTGKYVSTILISLPISPGVLQSAPVVLTWQGVLDVHTPPDTASATISFVVGVRSICGANLIAAIPWSILSFVGGSKTEMVW